MYQEVNIVLMIHYILMFLHECLDMYIQWKLAAQEWLYRMYQDVQWIRYSVDTITNFTKTGYNKIYKIRMEPDIDSWSNMSRIQINHYRYSEEYSELTSDVYDTYNTGIQSFPDDCDGLWLIKFDNSCYFSRIIEKKSKPSIPKSLIYKVSTVRFLSITYTHPNMNYDVPFELPKSMYIGGNQLFTSTFVMRMLEYTVGSNYVFDMNYTLKIMDRNVKYAELSSNQYIELGVDSWTLCKIA